MKFVFTYENFGNSPHLFILHFCTLLQMYRHAKQIKQMLVLYQLLITLMFCCLLVNVMAPSEFARNLVNFARKPMSNKKILLSNIMPCISRIGLQWYQILIILAVNSMISDYTATNAIGYCILTDFCLVLSRSRREPGAGASSPMAIARAPVLNFNLSFDPDF